MRIDTSYGIIPLSERNGEWEVFLVRLQQGHWGFPKGHAEVGETPKETASRELFEETGLAIEEYLAAESLAETYIFTFQKERIKKTVHYFLAKVKGEICLQVQEIAEGQWVSLSLAPTFLTFPEGKRILQKVTQSLI